MSKPEIESPRLLAFARVTRRRRGAAAVERAWKSLTRKGVPLVETVAGDPTTRLVTFVWRPTGRVTAPSVSTPISDFTTEGTRLSPVGRTGVYYRPFHLSPGARATYGFSPRPLPAQAASDEEWYRYNLSVRPDPLNPNRIPTGPKSWSSVAEVPGGPRAPWDKPRGPLRWKESQRRMRGRGLKGTRPVWVYLPPGYDPAGVSYNLVIAFDGDAYREAVRTPQVVQNLVEAGRIGPTVLVLVGNAPGGRVPELNRNPVFSRFLARELLPWLGRRYRLRVDGSRTVVAGSSLGAIAAVDAACRYPRLFSKVLVQSGAFQWPGPGISLMQEFARSPRRPLRFYLEAGKFETVVFPGMATSLLGSVRHMRDVLVAKGYPITYSEFDGGHDYACWSGTLGNGLLTLLGPRRKSAR